MLSIQSFIHTGEIIYFDIKVKNNGAANIYGLLSLNSIDSQNNVENK